MATRCLHLAAFRLLIALAMLSLGLRGDGDAGAALAQEAGEVVRIGVLRGSPLSAASGDTPGFAIDLAGVIASELGSRLEVVEIQTVEALREAHLSGAIELSIGTANWSEGDGGLLFSQPVADLSDVLFVLTERAPRLEAEGFRGLAIGVPVGASAGLRSDLAALGRVLEFESIPEALFAVLRGDIDGVALPYPRMLVETVRAGVDYRFVSIDPIGPAIDVAVAARPGGAEMMPAVRRILADLETDGRLPALRRKHFLEALDPVPEVLTVGVTSFPPYSIQNADGTFSGFAVESMRELARLAGLRLEFKAISAEEFGIGPSPETYDLLPQAGVNAGRREIMDFTLPVEESSFSIFVRPGELDAVSDLDDLSGMRVGVRTVNLGRQFVEGHGGSAEIVYFDDQSSLLDALLEGEVEALVYSTEPMREEIDLRGLSGRVHVVAPPVLRVERAVALRFGLGQVREQLNAVIPRFVVSTAYAELQAKYFGEPAHGTRLAILRVGAASGGFVVLVLLFAGGAQLRSRARLRVAAERERRAAEIKVVRDELETVLNTATSGILALDSSGRVVRVNARARQMLGETAEETPFDWPEGVGFVDPVSLAELEPEFDPIRRALEGRTLRGETYLLRQTAPREAHRFVRIDSAGLQNAESAIAVVLVIDDVSDEERNRQVVERGNRLDALGQLTGGIAHDFNNLLASLLYSVNLARGTNNAEKRYRYLEIASHSIERGRELTSRLLAFAKKQPGLASSRPANEVLHSLDLLIRPMIEAKVEIVVQPADAELRVFCEQVQLETALMNLVLNSRDSIVRSGSGGRIEVRVRPAGQTIPGMPAAALEGGAGADSHPVYRFVEFAVVDNGPGMDKETLARCTDPFFSTKESGSGTGLGLAMVYGFARQSDGDLRIYSEPETGTTVQLVLPRGTDEGPREQPVWLDPPVFGTGETVLLVEDEAELLFVMTEMLEALGYNVISARSGEEAVARIGNGAEVDLLLTDVVMPGAVGGFELARRVRDLRHDIPVIYMSGYTGFSPGEMGEVRAQLLQKPAAREELAHAISRALREACPA